MQPLKYILALLTLTFMTNSHAADNFDAANNTLTIPQVVVGNTTFNNVVLKLNDFQVLKVDPQPATNTIACNNYAAGTSYCTDGKDPTCNVSTDQANRINVGMTYAEVVQILGCHGVLKSRSGPVAIYIWNGPDYQSHGIGFYDGKVHSVS